MRKRYFLLASLALLLGLGARSAQAAEDIGVTAQAYCLIDADTGQLLLSRRANEPRQVASTTKMLTALLTVEYIDNLAGEALVSEYAARTPAYTIGLSAGQRVKAGELLKACLVKSSNDAAVVLAELVAGDERFFAELLSKKAFALGAARTFFVNASGLPDERHVSTAYDLAKIGAVVLKTPLIGELVGVTETEFDHPAYLEPMTIGTTNGLLNRYAGANGIKTGTANAAGNCLVGSAEREGRTLIAAVLKSGDRVGDCARLLDYGFLRTETAELLSTDESVCTLRLLRGAGDEVEVYPAKTIRVRRGEAALDIEKKLYLKRPVRPPLAKGQALGRMDLFIDGVYWDSATLLSGGDVAEEGGLFRKFDSP
jgi:D-alanyl-D-alanine carboxypeptidase (penicillin-binding protein 5/6)